MKRMLLCLVPLIMLVGCGGGGGGGVAGGDNDPAPWGGGYNAAGFPEVAGTYAFATEDISYTCGDDPFVGKLEGVAIVLKVQQVEGKLNAESTEEVADPKVEILAGTTPLTGDIDVDGYFSMAQTVVYSHADYPGVFTAIHDLQGLFTVAGWSGEYRYSIDDGESLSCDYATRFSGARLPATPEAAAQRASALANTDPATGVEAAGRLLGRQR